MPNFMKFQRVVLEKYAYFQESFTAFNRNFLPYYARAAFNWVLLVKKKNLRIAGFFVSLPFLTYIFDKKSKAINTPCPIMKKKKLRIAEFFASLPFPTYIYDKRLKPLIHCVQ